MVDIVALTDSLFDASYAGVVFQYLDSRDEVGRRTLRFLFPGSDQPAFQDLGKDDGTIHITGMLIGDDHVRQANKLRNAFQTAGPATLVHPWLGELQVVLASRAKFEDAQDSIRVTKFEAEFWRWKARVPDPPTTLDKLLDSLDDLRTAARKMLREALAPVRLALSTLAYVGRFGSQLRGWFDIAVGGGLQNIAAESLANLNGIAAIIPDADYADAVTDDLAAPSTALADASNPTVPAAVGPGSSATTATAIDGRLTVAVMLAVVTDVAATMSDASPGPELSIATRALILADAASAASDISFTSAQEATTWRDSITAAYDAAAADVATVLAGALPATSPAAIGAVWDALVAARARWMADMNALIGRLPSVGTLTLPGPVPAWLIAAYLAGDDLTQVVPQLTDIVARNKLRGIGRVSAATIEVLQ